MTSAEDHFLAGLGHHKAGRTTEAERCYRAALAADGAHFKALQHLGALCAGRGDHGAAADLFGIEPVLFDVWMRLVKDHPGSVLWLSIGDPATRDNLRREAAARAVAPDRLVFAGRIADRAAYLGRLKLIDVFLDTRCYGSHATASDLLWAGVPLVAVTGRSFATRVSAALLQTAGLDELIAPDLAAYEAISRSLAEHPERRAAVRATLERHRAALFDMGAYTRALETAFCTMTAQRRAGHLASFTVSR